MKCPVCGSEIKFSYVTPPKSYYIKDNKIIRDDQVEGPEYDDPYFNFYCSNDAEHNIHTDLVEKWADKIEERFVADNIA